MIIECPNCNKKFNLDEILIPENGRSLKCSNCEHIWHYRLEVKKEAEGLKLSEDQKSKLDINSSEVNKKENKSSTNDEKNPDSINEVLSEETSDTADVDVEYDKLDIEENTNIKMMLSYFIILIISILGLILLLNTFKMNLSIIFPDIIPFFNSLNEILLDLKLFLKDLVN